MTWSTFIPERDAGTIFSTGESIASRGEVDKKDWWQCTGSHITKTVGMSPRQLCGSPEENIGLNKMCEDKLMTMKFISYDKQRLSTQSFAIREAR